jgi:DNA polymerase-3 subunit alpha
MSKKKQYVIDEERQSFIYGDEKRGIKGCLANGISERAANSIYDSMVDFAKYAFNKSHAAAYAVISVQTAWLKCYYPVEYMAALMTSVIDNSSKAAEYLLHCKELNIGVLPPDVNIARGEFTPDGKNIRYGLYAIKSLGRPVIDKILEEREEGGPYRTLRDFIERTMDRDLNKRAIENLILAGACDSFDANRHQMSVVYATMVDDVMHRKKSGMSGQISLFDLVSEEEKKDYEIKYPDLPEFNREELLNYEKEVLGIYLSGHPLDEYISKMEENTTAHAADFLLDEQTGKVSVRDGSTVVVGGMIAAKSLKFTRNNKQMAFLTLEDLTGSVEVIVFPNQFERYRRYIEDDAKIYIVGKATVEEEQAGKIICDRIISFDDLPKEVWLQFPDRDTYGKRSGELMTLLKQNVGGADEIVVYIKSERKFKKFGKGYAVNADLRMLELLYAFVGEKNVKLIEKNIEKPR